MKYPFLSKTITFCKSYIELCIWLLVFAVGIRFFEAIFLSCQANHHFGSSIVWNLIGLCYDISLYLRISVCILVLFVTTCLLNEKTARIILRILQSLILLLSLIGIVFFATSGYLLDKAVFSYTFKEMLFIIQSSSKSPIWVYVVVVALPVLYFFVSGKRIKINRIFLIIFTVLTVSSFFVLNKLSLNTDQYHIKVNKEYFFLKSIFKNQTFTFKEGDEEVIKAIEEFRSYFPEHQFAEIEYPFLYKSECKDVLSPFFNLKSEPPHLVFIIVEGLGYEYLYNDYQLMPFLDSLSQQSLSWEHCFSVAPRTFGVLPALFGNSPTGEKGFLELCPYNPEYHSLTRILHQNNYTNYFFHGGLSSWIKMDIFSQENKMIYLKNDEWDIDIKNETIGATWGYEDHLIYEQALRNLNRQTARPRMDIYLSQSTHDPFEYPQKTHFQKIVKNKVNNCKSLSNKQKTPILNDTRLYGSFAYADWALQQLMESYSKRTDFGNTIFIITGDHHVLSKQFGGYYNYHVPLIIYSPMLKSARKMKGVVSHRDITPTVLSFLQNNYDTKIPDEVTWLNTALDTSITFNANTFSYLQNGVGYCEGILFKNYLYCEGVLDELTENGCRRIENPAPAILQQMNRLLFLYKMTDSYTLQNDALIRKQYAEKTILDIEDTIAIGSYFASRSELPVLEAPDGHKTALYFDSTIIYPVNFLTYSFPDDDIEKFRVVVEFKLYLKDGIGERLNLVIDMSKNGENVIAKTDYLTNAKSNQWYDYKYSFVCTQNLCKQLGKGCYLKVYLNSRQQEAYIDDIKVKFIVENRQIINKKVKK